MWKFGFCENSKIFVCLGNIQTANQPSRDPSSTKCSTNADQWGRIKRCETSHGDPIMFASLDFIVYPCLGWIPRNFQNFHFRASIVIFEGKITKIIIRMNFWIFTNSPFIWFSLFSWKWSFLWWPFTWKISKIIYRVNWQESEKLS